MTTREVKSIIISMATSKRFIVAMCAAIAMILGAISVGATKYVFKTPATVMPMPIGAPASATETTSQHQTDASSTGPNNNPTASAVMPSTAPPVTSPTPQVSPSTPTFVPKIKPPASIPEPPANGLDVQLPPLTSTPPSGNQPLLSLDGGIFSAEIDAPSLLPSVSIGLRLP